MAVLRAEITGRRLRELAEAAVGQFCRQGYERCQVADVAKAMKVAVGTVYLYVEGKEALFDLAIRDAANEDRGWLDTLEIPVKTPAPGAILEFLRSAFEERAEWPVLSAALESEGNGDAVPELRAILAEQYALTWRYRRVLLLLTRSALEYPGLTEVFVNGLRDRLLEKLAIYLSQRASAGQLAVVGDYRASAAVMIQAVVWATLQRPYDPGLADLSAETMESATLDLLAHGMSPKS